MTRPACRVASNREITWRYAEAQDRSSGPVAVWRAPVLLAVASAAARVPARRAALVHPARTLRIVNDCGRDAGPVALTVRPNRYCVGWRRSSSAGRARDPATNVRLPLR